MKSPKFIPAAKCCRDTQKDAFLQLHGHLGRPSEKRTPFPRKCSEVARGEARADQHVCDCQSQMLHVSRDSQSLAESVVAAVAESSTRPEYLLRLNSHFPLLLQPLQPHPTGCELCAQMLAQAVSCLLVPSRVFPSQFLQASPSTWTFLPGH